MIELRGLCRDFDGTVAVDQLSLEVAAGELVVLVGACQATCPSRKLTLVPVLCQIPMLGAYHQPPAGA